MTNQQIEDVRRRAMSCFEKTGIILTKAEQQSLEIADLGFGRFDEIGMVVLEYINTKRCCAKELMMFPGQVFPEHRHPPIDNDPGKEETFRCRRGEVYLYVPGEPVQIPRAKLPEDKKDVFTVWHEIVLKPGDQYTLSPDTLHWFQAGSDGAVVSEFSTTSRDEMDFFTDPEVLRVPEA